jgi:hypothetical protein
MDTLIHTMQEIMVGLKSVETKDDRIDIITTAVYGPVMGKCGSAFVVRAAYISHFIFPNYS